MIISTEVREKLKQPLGSILSIEEIKKIKAKRIIAVGDITTLELIANGILPHLAIFDFYSMRKKISKKNVLILKKCFPKRKVIENKRGEVSEELIENAKKILKKGGAIQIEGEEDLTALAFFNYIEKGDILLYGQPKKGIVCIKKKISHFPLS